MSNKDQVKGRVKTAQGKVKEAAGKLVGNRDLEAEGKIDQVGGKIQSKYGDIKQELKEDLDDIDKK